MQRSRELYCKLRYYEPSTEEYNDLEADTYTLLDIVNDEWYGDKNRGLAQYAHDELNDALSAIQYSCHMNMLKFRIILNEGFDWDTIITYDGKKMAIYNAVCNFIVGQLEDGWGEEIHIKKWLSDVIICVWNPSEGLLEIDEDKTVQKIRENNLSFLHFKENAVFKKIENCS